MWGIILLVVVPLLIIGSMVGAGIVAMLVKKSRDKRKISMVLTEK